MKCWKVQFDLVAAKNALARCKRRHRSEIRYYKCQNCAWYHLTSHK